MPNIETQELSPDAIPNIVWMPGSIVGQPTIFCGSHSEILRQMAGKDKEPMSEVITSLVTYLKDILGVEIELHTEDKSDDKRATMLLYAILSCGIVRASPHA
jgi:hypothetical protein